ncbi:MAG: hypothetical protein ACRDI2_18500, partial [Chloroflexota bacterium]
WVLRARLNAWLSPGLATKVQYEVRPRIETNAPAPAHQPPGTLSQIIEYRDPKGELFVLAHRYLLPGSRSTPPDPKWLWDAVVEHLPRHDPERFWCDDCPPNMRGGKTRYAPSSEAP